jgi:uncharacterized membrane protein YcaP (DUF421 family)
MKPEEIKLNDWMRIVFGNVPAEFYIELIIRGFLVYLLLMVSMRLLGKRMSGQISRIELATLVALASAIGVPMLSPINGILPAFIIVIIIVGISRLLSFLIIRSEKFENVAKGGLDTLVHEGVMNLDIMTKVRITRERLFAELRSEKINQLGKVKRLYMEANGSFTLLPQQELKPGLLVLPAWDEPFIEEVLKNTDILICKECGAGKPQNSNDGNKEVACNNCGADQWVQAVVEK